MESRDLVVSVWKVSGLVSVLVSKVSDLEIINIAKKRFIKISIIQRFVFVVFAGKKQAKHVGKMLEICKKCKSEVVKTFKKKTLRQNVQILKSQVSVLVSEFLIKSRSRFKILTMPRSRPRR